jgi:hypothetical protein
MGERDLELDPVHAKASNLVEFPDETTPTRLYNGVPFNQIPLMIVRTHKNNTIIIFADFYNKVGRFVSTFHVGSSSLSRIKWT